MSFASRYGQWAVVTGGAHGVGRAFAVELAQRGVRPILVDVDPVVEQTAEDVPGQTRWIVADVTTRAWLAELDGLDIGLVVANAGVCPIGRFADVDHTEIERTIAVNCSATAMLAHWAVPRLSERGRGGIIFTSSGSALAGTAGIAVYSATKAFAVNLAEALAVEAGPQGVDVQAVVAPSMDTPGFQRSGADEAAMVAPAVEPGVVVRGALDALGESAVWLADDGLAFLAGMPRSERVRIMADVTAAMYPRLGSE